MNPPIFYILIALVLTSATISIIFFIAWKNLVHERYTLSWSLGFFCAMCQWSCTLLRDYFPNFQSYWLLANGLALCLITLVLRGHAERAHAEFVPRNLWPYTSAAFAIVAWTTLVNPHIGVSTAVAPFAATIALVLSAYLVYAHRPVPRPAEVAASVTMVLFGAVQLIAAGLALLQGSTGDPGFRSAYYEFNFVTLPAGYIGVAMFTIFMLASDMSEQMKKIAVSDQLTGLLNRRGFTELTTKAYASSRRTERPVSVIMTDIDHFKDINDAFVHAAGDLALKHFADILRTRRRAEDIVARMGGEEFALVLPGTVLADASALAETLCAQVGNMPLDVGGRTIPMTASFGVSAILAGDECLTDVIVRADRALYRSKRGGRNRVDIETDAVTESRPLLYPVS